jgi:hypothetical protein
MHFVSTFEEPQQIEEVCQYLKANLTSSVKNKDDQELAGFEERLEELLKATDYLEILKFILSKKKSLGTLPTTHRQQHLTIQRLVLLILPLFQALDSESYKREYEEVKQLAISYCQFLEESEYPLQIKVNS